MMFQQRQAFLLGNLHAGRVLAGCEACALTEQQQLSANNITQLHCNTGQPTHTQPFNGLWSGTTRAGQYQKKHSPTHTHLMANCPGLPGCAGTRKVKPIWILLEQESVSGSGISWVICKPAPRSRQITTPAPHCSVFYRLDALPATQPTVSKH